MISRINPTCAMKRRLKPPTGVVYSVENRCSYDELEMHPSLSLIIGGVIATFKKSQKSNILFGCV